MRASARARARARSPSRVLQGRLLRGLHDLLDGLEQVVELVLGLDVAAAVQFRVKQLAVRGDLELAGCASRRLALDFNILSPDPAHDLGLQGAKPRAVASSGSVTDLDLNRVRQCVLGGHGGGVWRRRRQLLA
uniref:Uncharacterized protein n=2 Tax=Bicosoecida sp. CB-2014 TaxID=1486930 RepID=A0A7S1CJI7_9STRA